MPGLKDKVYNMNYREADAKHMSDKLFRLAKMKARDSGDFYREPPAEEGPTCINTCRVRIPR
jgi:hypothetical protein